MPDRDEKPRRRPLGLAALLFGAVCLALLAALALTHPSSPLPPQWNPAAPLSVSHPWTALTRWKLARTARNGPACMAALAEVAEFQPLPAIEDSADCHLRQRVLVLTAVNVAMTPALDTNCATALRLAIWLRHGLGPAAQAELGADVRGLRQQGSYNCRPIRTEAGQGTRMSAHATGDAIDIAGFALSDGREVILLRDWASPDGAGRFLRRARDSACESFVTVLSPEYNALHADHFHMQGRGWGLCK